ncbi:MAG: hypothetical protein SGILL_000421 [Bacillariaceae sp.]
MSDQHNSKKQDELDSFLTTIESKLRGPFSSLDLAKAVSTAALRSRTSILNDPANSGISNATAAAKHYLHNLSQVMSRTDKVIQCRMLIGLMGLTDNDERSTNGDNNHQNTPEASSLTPEILQILEETQGGSLHEEWVRTTSGLIQGIMFRDASGNTRGSCRGEEAAKIIENQGEEVSEKIKHFLDHHHKHHTDQKEPDLNACFAPYRYSLISTNVLNTIIAEFQIQKDGEKSKNGNQMSFHQNIGNNCHFHVNANADILQVDWKLEDQRAKEEEQHGGTGTAGLAGISGSKKEAGSTSPTSGKANLPPGFRPAKLVNSPKSNASNSMFMPKAKSSSLFNTSAKNRPVGGKTLLRRKGGAQALVRGSSMKQRMANAAGGGAGVTGAAGAVRATGLSGAVAGARGAGRFTGKGRSAMAAGRSKMKMIDVEEASNLTKQHELAHQNTNSRALKRKRILEAAKQEAANAKKLKQAESAPKPAAPPLAAEPEDSNKKEPSPPQQTEEWEKMLQGRTNKLFDADKLRIKQFVEEKYNPTPDQHTYKMKIHEQKGTDPDGAQIKETFYLELNYDDFTTKQSKKIKRY